MNLTDLERLQLRNQFLILAQLQPNEASTYSRFVTIIEEGFTHDYPDLFQSIQKEYTPEQTQRVLDVLNMFRDLRFSFDSLSAPDQDGINRSSLAFRGFDGNKSARELNYAEFQLEQCGHYPELRCDEGYNSCCEWNEYQPMVAMWKKFDGSPANCGKLTRDQILAILGVS